jgi:hypothetical protein
MDVWADAGEQTIRTALELLDQAHAARSTPDDGPQMSG